MLGARSHSHCCHPPKDTLVYSNARAYPLVPLCRLTWPAQVPSMTISIDDGVNPLQTTLLELGIVSGRVALLLRSAEIQPVFGRFVTNGFIAIPPLLFPWGRNATGRGARSCHPPSVKSQKPFLIGRAQIKRPPNTPLHWLVSITNL